MSNANQQDTDAQPFRHIGRIVFGLLVALTFSNPLQATTLDLNNYNTLNDLNDLVVAIKNNMPDENSELYTPPSQQIQTDIHTVVTDILNGQDPANIILPASLQNHYTLSEFVDNGQIYVVLAETADNDNNNTAPCFNDPKYKIADAAHNEAHTFHTAVEAIDNHYNAQFQTHTAIQFHGMGDASSNGLEVYMTHGSKRVPLANSMIDQIKSDLTISQPTWGVAVPGDPTVTELNGISNLQGRLLNDVVPSAICQTRAYSYTGHFVHIEQTSDAREANAYDEWIQALSNINTGQQIAQLVNHTQNAGRHIVRFDAKHLASGFYFYQIRANNQISTNKMMLIK